MRRSKLGAVMVLALSAMAVSWAGSAALGDLPPLSATAIANGAVITRAQGYEFVTVRALGNAPVPRNQQGTVADPMLGSIEHPYAIARTEVTYGEYLGFVRAYASIHGINTPFMVTFLGRGITFAGGDQFNPANYTVDPSVVNYPVQVGWRYAARYCNWLTNNKSSAPSAFETGSYDGSTFLPDPANNGPTSDRVQRLPGAQFFLPTVSEWIKAMYFDQNLGGPGQAGYWNYPTAANLPPRSGVPSAGGQTSRGLVTAGFLPVASYPAVMSPWGLFDGSGGVSEWIEAGDLSGALRLLVGSDIGSVASDDALYTNSQGTLLPVESRVGIRLAMTIPTPGSGVVAVFGGVFWMRRRHRCARGGLPRAS